MSEWNPTTLRQMQDAKPVAVSQNEKPVPGGAPVYEVLARSYIGGRIVEPGERVPYQWRPGQFLRHVAGPTWDEWRKAHPEFDSPTRAPFVAPEDPARVAALERELADLRAQLAANAGEPPAPPAGNSSSGEF